MSSNMRITSALAPPCSGPFSAQMAATIAECRSVSVAAATRAANVDALSSWSACSTSDTSNARASSADGRWAYTLYARRGHQPFVHALDTTGRKAYCIDLPLELGYDLQWTLRLKLYKQGRLLVVTRGKETQASVHTATWRVSKL